MRAQNKIIDYVKQNDTSIKVKSTQNIRIKNK